MKLCVFQGTFNPIHNAHLSMADYISRKYNFDKILFIPAFIPPHKNCINISANHRLNMVKLAVAGNTKFDVSDIEYKSNDISYTFITVSKLYDEFSIDGKINFIIGSDAFEKIESWYETAKLRYLVKFLVFKRADLFDEKSFEDLRLKGYDFEFVTMNFMDISSTEIRDMIVDGKDVSAFLPERVKEYIYDNSLYKSQ